MVSAGGDVFAGPQPPARDRTRDMERGQRGEEQPGWNRDGPGGGRRGGRLGPGFAEEDQPWYLGVEVAYRDYGAEVTHVERRSPARLAGLEVRDTIVTVNGYQVGRVNGRLYELDRELELRAGRRGRVTLLVQDRRGGRLTPLPVRLERAEPPRSPLDSESIIGSIRSARPRDVPRRGVLTVRLLDVTDQRPAVRGRAEDRPSGEVVAERSYREFGPFPFPFELEYDRGEIRPDRDYALAAEIRVNGRVELRTAEPYPVLEREDQGRVHMVLERVR